MLSELQGHSAAWPFLQPVNGEEVADYYDVIKNPMGMRHSPFLHSHQQPCHHIADFSTMEHKLNHNVYPDINSFVSDANLVFSNCMLYNPEGSIYAKSAAKLQKFLTELVADAPKSSKTRE